jgi:hypothetical protein
MNIQSSSFSLYIIYISVYSISFVQLVCDAYVVCVLCISSTLIVSVA